MPAWRYTTSRRRRRHWGTWERAARLFGSFKERVAVEYDYAQVPPPERADLEAALAPARAVLGEERWAAEYAAGAALSREEVVRDALQVM
jgi:hypothetical protein